MQRQMLFIHGPLTSCAMLYNFLDVAFLKRRCCGYLQSVEGHK